MNEFAAANWPLIAVGVVLALAVLCWILFATRRTRVSIDRRDTLEDGAASAARNHALIDAPPAAAPLPPLVPEAIGAAGVAVAASAQEAQAQAVEEDDLTQMKGLGPKLAITLQHLGVTSYAQIAGWNEADIDRIDAQLGRFQGRIRRDSWVEQARFLAKGDRAGFNSRFGAS